MRATKVEAYEKSFFDTGVDSGGKKHILTPFEAGGVPMIGAKLENGDKSFYYEEVAPKERIVVHFTQGYLKGDIDTLTKPNNHVSVALVVARSGAIVNLWSSKYWSYHLGKGASGGNKEMSSSSVAHRDLQHRLPEEDRQRHGHRVRRHLLRSRRTGVLYRSGTVPLEKRYGIVNDVADFRGITTHVNYRQDKWDIGPAFDWDRVIAGVTA